MPKIGDIAKSKEVGYNHKNYDKYIWSACIDCGKERWVSLRRGKPANIRCRSCAKKGKNNGNWIGGKTKMSGYILIYQGKGRYYGEHRLVMEKYLGRTLKTWEHIHHINGIRDDNRLGNLAVLSRDGHMEITSKLCKRINELEKENYKLKKELCLCKNRQLNPKKKKEN